MLNIALFTPLGIALAAYGWSPRKALLQAVVLSASLELIEIFNPGRDSALGDVVFNTLGAAAGSFIVATGVWWLRPSEQLGLRLSLLAIGAATAVCPFSAYALQPSFPRTRQYGQWTPELGHAVGRVAE